MSLSPVTQLSKAKGNLQDNARLARYQLLENWAISKIFNVFSLVTHWMTKRKIS